MTIRHLRIFIAVADYKTMSRAARELYISQPSVSQAIIELESYYGVRLFERLTQKLFLTEQGAQLLDAARYVVKNYDAMDLMMKQSGEAAHLRIGASVSVGTCLLSDLILNLKRKDSNVECEIYVNNTSTIEQRTLQSEIDIAIVEGRLESDQFIRIPLCKDELVIVVGNSHRFASVPSIEIAQLAQDYLIAREEESAQRNQYEQLLLQRDIKLRTSWQSSNTEAIKSAVMGGHGFAILSKMIIANEVKEGRLHIVPVQGVKVEREITLIYHKDKYISKPMKQFIAISKELVR